MRSVLSLVLVLVAGCTTQTDPSPRKPVSPGEAAKPKPKSKFVVGEPIRHDGVAIFPVYDPSAKTIDPIGDYLTLEDALKSKEIAIEEVKGGGSVPKLILTNHAKRPILITAGEIVKGGKQDRVMARDLLIQPGTKSNDISVFCVESGRWSRGRLGGGFGYSGKAQMMLKETVQAKKEQREVWNSVARANAANAGDAAAVSTSYHKVTMSDPKVAARVKAYGDAFARFEPDAKMVGLVLAIGDKVVSVEIYGHSRLFAKSRKETLRSLALDAVTHFAAHKKVESSATLADAQTFVDDIATGKSNVEFSNDNRTTSVQFLNRSNNAYLLQDAEGNVLHINAYRKK